MTARADGAAATKDRIARAAMALFLEQAFDDVTLAAIAKASGVSHQTVLNHFESKEGVALAVAVLLAEETTQARYTAEPGDVAGAVAALVGDYERLGDANFRWAATAERMSQLAALLADARAGHQEWIVTMFAVRLPVGAAARRRAVRALHAATDVYTWKLLRRDLQIGRAETERIIVDLVVGVLEGTNR